MFNCNTSEAMNNMFLFNNMNGFNNNMNLFNNNNWFQPNNINQFNNINWFNNNLNKFINNMLQSNKFSNNLSNENIITKHEVDTFLKNVKNSKLANENLEMQLYSLLGNRSNTPAYDNTYPDEIQFVMNFIEDHVNNNFNNYKKINNNSIKVVYVLLDYYLKNIELFNHNNALFSNKSINYLNNSLHYSFYDFQNALDIIIKYNFYNVFDKIIKGINSVENIKTYNNAKISSHNNNPILLSNGTSKCFLVSAVQQFIGALKQSSESDYIRKTTFAKFVKYMRMKQLNNTNKIDFIKTLREFVRDNKYLFNTKAQQEALNSLFAQENGTLGGAPGYLGTIFMLRIFPELQQIFSGNNFGNTDILLNSANSFKFNNGDLNEQFDSNNNACVLMSAINYKKCYKPFDSNNYIIDSTLNANIDDILNKKQYISFYNDLGNLEIYELASIQLRTKIGSIGHFISYVKQSENSNSWSLIDSLERKGNNNHKNNNHKINDIFALLNTSKYVVQQVMYKKVQ